MICGFFFMKYLLDSLQDWTFTRANLSVMLPLMFTMSENSSLKETCSMNIHEGCTDTIPLTAVEWSCFFPMSTFVWVVLFPIDHFIKAKTVIVLESSEGEKAPHDNM